jgi:arylsulfatase A-like enzyme
VAVSVLLLLSGGTELKKINLSGEDIPDPEACREFSILPFQVNRTAYFASRGQTAPGRLVLLDNQVRQLEFQPRLRGRYSLEFELINTSLRSLRVQMYQNNRLLLDRGIDQDRSHRINRELNLGRRDTFHLRLKGRGMVIISNPLFYRIVPPEKREYVFLICADTLRADHLPVYGYHRDTAPRISRFIGDCVTFDRAYAQGTWTLPSHMSLFTARYEWNHGVRKDTMIPDDIDYLVEAVSRRFVTRSFNGGIYVSSRFGFFRGFDSYVSIDNDQFMQNSSEHLFKLAAGDLDRQTYPRSFYFLHTYQVHSPYDPPEKYLKAFHPDPPHRSLTAPTVPTNHRDQFQKLPPEMVQNYIDLYDAEILAFDEWFGYFTDHLKESGIYDQSMIILMSDHGEEFFDHGGWGHTHSLYDELIRVPLIIKFPGNRYRNTRVFEPVGLIDIMPTILHHYRLPYPEERLDGISLIPLLEKGSARGEILSSLTTGFYVKQLPFKLSRIRGQRKIIYNLPYTKETFEFFKTPPPPVQRFEYYDLIKDPAEQVNLVEQIRDQLGELKIFFNGILRQVNRQLQKQLREVDMDYRTRQKFKSLGYISP